MFPPPKVNELLCIGTATPILSALALLHLLRSMNRWFFFTVLYAVHAHAGSV